jgi:hypothetical protein
VELRAEWVKQGCKQHLQLKSATTKSQSSQSQRVAKKSLGSTALRVCLGGKQMSGENFPAGNNRAGAPAQRRKSWALNVIA